MVICATVMVMIMTCFGVEEVSWGKRKMAAGVSGSHWFLLQRFGLEGDLDRALEDAGLVGGGGDLAEGSGGEDCGASGGSAGSSGGSAGGDVEVGVVEDVEGLEAQGCGPAL